MERLTPAALPRWNWIWPVAGVALLLIGPQNLARVVSAVSGLLVWPLTRHLEISGNGYEVANLELLLVYVIVVVGMNVFSQTGLFSLGHTVFFAIGAYTVAILTTAHHVSFWLAMPCGAVLAGLAGLVLALPAGRLGSFTFAMITLGYALTAGDLLLDWDSITGGGDGILGIERPAPFDDQNTYYWIIAIAVVLACAVARNLLRSPYGRAAKAIETSLVAARSLGIDPARTKIRTFAVSAVFAGVGGALFAPLQGLLGPSSFGVNLAILFLLMVLLGGSGTVAGPILGAVLLFRIPLAVESITDRPGDVSLMVYGVVLVASIYVVPRGLMSAWWRLRARIRRRWGTAEQVGADRERADLADVITEPDAVDGPALELTGVRIALGGVQALDGVDLKVEPGTVHALIGPNGSGKTTLLNVISGYLTPDEGTVAITGRPVRRLPAHARIRQGLSRTFQTPHVLEGVSCGENVLIAVDHERRSRALSHLAGLPRARREEREGRERAFALLDAVGLAHRAEDDAGDLPPGERRLLELARVLAVGPRVVLMDEPAGGLNSAEIGHLEDFVRALRAAGIAVLLVEHHVEMVMRLADQVTVVNFGRDISHGTAEQVRRDPAVVSAYLGDDHGDSASTSVESGGR